MLMRFGFLFFLFCFFFSPAFAFNVSDYDFLFSDGSLDQKVIDYANSNIDFVSSEVLLLFENKRINVFVSSEDGSVKSYGVVFSGKKISNVFLGKLSDADAELSTSSKVVERIVFSKDPFSSFLSAFNSGEIKFVGLSNEGKAASMAASVVGFFFSLFDSLKNFFSSLLNFFS